MFELFKGDTFLKDIRPTNDYRFQVGDKLKVAVMRNEYSTNKFFEKEFEISEEAKTLELLIEPEKTSEFETGELLLEFEFTYGDGIVKTTQYKLVVKEDGIDGRN